MLWLPIKTPHIDIDIDLGDGRFIKIVFHERSIGIEAPPECLIGRPSTKHDLRIHDAPGQASDAHKAAKLSHGLKRRHA